MNVYLNLKPNNYEGDTDLLTLDLPSHYIDDIMKYARPIAEERQTAESKGLKDIFKQSIFEISRRENERKSRKNKKR